MLTTLIIIIIVAALLLWVVILVQNPKGGGISSQFGGSSVTNIIGAKQSVDVIEKATWVLGIAVVVLVVLSSFITKPQQGEVGPGLEGGTNLPIDEPTIDEMPEGAVPFNGTTDSTN
ncbi:MAG: preprotein translocase subunit SecG [Bacteroidia bacterium]